MSWPRVGGREESWLLDRFRSLRRGKEAPVEVGGWVGGREESWLFERLKSFNRGKEEPV